MLFTNYIKPSEVSDFTRTIYRHNTQAMPLYELLKVRIIYNLVNYPESLNEPTKSSSFTQAKSTKQAKIAKAEIFGSIAAALVLVAMFGGVA